MTSEAEENALPMRAVLHAKDVVAAGRAENMLQLPSPIYTAEFTDANHVLLGAGGGGRKFGMPNIALLLRVQSVCAEEASQEVSKKPPSAAATTATAAEASPAVWRFAAAVDLGVDIPWCTSAFLPFNADASASPSSSLPSSSSAAAAAAAAPGSATDPAALGWSSKQRQVLQGLVGFVALSSITAFTLIGVYRGAEPTLANPENASADLAGAPSSSAEKRSDQRYVRQLARITVPHDDKDPDKKPIALSQNVLVVSHDSNGVFVYALTDLVPDSFEDDDAQRYAARYAEQVKTQGVLQRRVPRVQTTATPVAEWHLPARVNDLSVNRVCIVQAESAPQDSVADDVAAPPAPKLQQACKAHLQEHLVLAAVLQNKTVELSTLRLHRKYGGKRKGLDKDRSPGGGNAPSSSSSTATLWMGTALTLTQAELPLPFKLLTSSLRIVRLFGWANINATQQAEMRRQLTWQSLQEKGKPTHGPLCSILLAAFNTHAGESFLVHGAVEVSQWPLGSSSSSSCGVGLKVRWAQPHPTPVLSDAITSIAVCDDRTPGDYAARVRRSPVGAAVPTHLLVGTVDGWVASLRWDAAEKRWHSDHVRPSPVKLVAARFPALHKEPVSCVAVSAENDVVSADIAQNVALTTVPYAVPAAGQAQGTGKEEEEVAYAVQRRLAAASALFPVTAADAGLLGWVAQEVAGGSMPVRVLLFTAVPLLLLLVAIFAMKR